MCQRTSCLASDALGAAARSDNFRRSGGAFDKDSSLVSFGLCLRPNPERSEQRTDQPETAPASSPGSRRRLPLPRLPRSGVGCRSNETAKGIPKRMFNPQEEGSKWGEPVGWQSILEVPSEHPELDRTLEGRGKLHRPEWSWSIHAGPAIAG